MQVELKKLNPRIDLKVATDGSAGYDVQSGSDIARSIYPSEQVKIPLGFSMHIKDKNVAALLMPRSSVGKKGIQLANTIGLIDSDYQGEVAALLKNTGQDVFVVEPLQRIGQLIFVPVIHPTFKIVTEFEASERGEGGFGSTDKVPVTNGLGEGSWLAGTARPYKGPQATESAKPDMYVTGEVTL